MRQAREAKEGEAKQREAAEKAAAPPLLAVSPADVELFRALLVACKGRVDTNPRQGLA